MRKITLAGFSVILMFGSAGIRAGDTLQKPAAEKAVSSMKIKLTSVFVEDQDKALEFYTETLGFVKKADIPVGEFKWLTVVSPDDPEGTELLLEPNANPTAKRYQKELFEQGIPSATFFAEDVQKEYERLTELGVRFTMEPTDVGSAIVAVFDDGCGNLIQIAQE